MGNLRWTICPISLFPSSVGETSQQGSFEKASYDQITLCFKPGKLRWILTSSSQRALVLVLSQTFFQRLTCYSKGILSN